MPLYGMGPYLTFGPQLRSNDEFTSDRPAELLITAKLLVAA